MDVTHVGKEGNRESGNQVFLPRLSLSFGAAGVEEGGGRALDGGFSAGALALKLCVMQRSCHGKSGGIEKGWSVVCKRERERETREEERTSQREGGRPRQRQPCRVPSDPSRALPSASG